jgi:hypothetical protein
MAGNALSAWWAAFVDENLYRTLIGAAFGTFAGAWLTRRGQAKKEIVTELNNVAAAIELAGAICNRYMALNRQHVRPMWDALTALKRKYEARQKAGGGRGPLIFTADFKTLPQTKAPLNALEGLLYNDISMRGRGLGAMAELVAAEDGLRAAIDARTDIIKEFKGDSERTEEVTLALCLGLRTKANVIDDRFPSNVEGIHVLTDCCIFFSHLIVDELIIYGNRLLKRYRWRLFGTGRSRFKQVDWAVAREKGLLPPASEFKDWLRGFPDVPTRQKRIAAAFSASRTGFFAAVIGEKVADVFARDPGVPGLPLLKAGAILWGLLITSDLLWFAWHRAPARIAIVTMLAVPVLLCVLTLLLSPTLLFCGILAGAPHTPVSYAFSAGFRHWRGVLGVILGLTALLGSAITIAGMLG